MKQHLYIDASIYREATEINGIYLYNVHSIVNGCPGFYCSTITAPTRSRAIVIILRCLSIITSVLARRSSGLISFRLGCGAIRHGRLPRLCANSIHDSVLSIASSAFCDPLVANDGSASTSAMTAVHKNR